MYVAGEMNEAERDTDLLREAEIFAYRKALFL